MKAEGSRQRAESRGSLWTVHCLLLTAFFLLKCDRPPRLRDLEATFTNDDLRLLAGVLNQHIRNGNLSLLDSGRNTYRFTLPGSPTIYALTVTVEPRIVAIPLGFASVRLNALRIREARVRWNVRERALQLQVDIEDKKDGILGEVRILKDARPLAFAVEGGRVNLYLEPRIGGDGKLDFAPIRGEILVNTDEAVPDVREIVRENLRQVTALMVKDVQAACDAYRGDLENWFASQLAPGALLTEVRLADDRATFRARLLEDLTGDGRVDIADLIFVAREFGEKGFPGFSPADLNRDGIVDIGDLVRIALRFGM